MFQPVPFRFLAFLSLMFLSLGAAGQKVISTQLGYNSIIHGVRAGDDSKTVVFGFFENTPSDSGWIDRNVIVVDSLGNFEEVRKYTKRNYANVKKIDALTKTPFNYAWVYHKECNEGRRGNEILIVSSDFNEIKSSFFVQHDHINVDDEVGDIVRLGDGNWITTFDTTALLLSRFGETIVKYPLTDTIDHILPISDERYFFWNRDILIVGDTAEMISFSDFGDTLVDLIEIDEEEELFALASLRNLRYINRDGDSRQTITAKYLKLDRIERLIFYDDLLYVFGRKGNKLVVRALDINDDVIISETLMSINPDESVKHAQWINGQFWLTIRRTSSNQHFDYCFLWKTGAKQIARGSDIVLSRVILDSVEQDSSKYVIPNLVDIKAQCRLRLFNPTNDTIFGFKIHHKGLYSLECQDNKGTWDWFKEPIPPHKGLTVDLTVEDFEINTVPKYPLCFSVSAPNWQIDTFLVNNHLCVEVNLSTSASRPAVEMGVYPNPVSSGSVVKIQIPSASLITEVRLRNADGREVQELHFENNALYTDHLQKGFYFLEAQAEDGTVYLQKLIIE